MKKFTLLFVLGIFFSGTFCAYGGINVPVKKMLTSDWLTDTWYKYGMIGSLCTAQAFGGLTESYRFSGRHIVSDDDYHIYKTGRDIAFLSAGYFLTSNLRSKRISWWTKAKRIIGSACLARNAFEWSYRWNRTGDPFNYSPAYSFNEKAIVYFKWSSDKGKFVDAYIGGTGRQGVLIDIAFLIVGIILVK